MVHNAVMCYTSFLFDSLVIFFHFVYNTEGPGKKDYSGCFSSLSRLNKVAGLACSVIWILKDTIDVATVSPGPGTIALGTIAVILSVVLLVFEMFAERRALLNLYFCPSHSIVVPVSCCVL